MRTFILLPLLFVSAIWLNAEPISVRFPEGSLHAFLVLRSADGQILSPGDLVQTVHGNRVVLHLTFHFKDGSLYDETSTFTQRHTFRLLSEHLVQKGPSFPHPIELTVDGGSGQVTVISENDGKPETKSEHMKIPADLANGIIFTEMRNLPTRAADATLSFLVPAQKPRLVHLRISRQEDDSFIVAGQKRKAIHYSVKFEIGGVAGAVAPLIGKEPPDTQVWILEDEVPFVLRSEGPLFEGGPIWQVELVSPVWPKH
jgi:hypothetical protein